MLRDLRVLIEGDGTGPHLKSLLSDIHDRLLYFNDQVDRLTGIAALLGRNLDTLQVSQMEEMARQSGQDCPVKRHEIH